MRAGDGLCVQTPRAGPLGVAMFITLDGVDGAGKSTQLLQFAEWLREQALEVVVCRDPGTTPLGETIRRVLLDRHETPIGRHAEMLLYMAARAQLVEQIIRPALAAGRIVVSDRFLLANVVYQGWAGGLDVEQLWQVGEVATGGLKPDLTILLDISAEDAARRREREPDRMEAQGLEYLERVRQGFLTEARRRPEVTVIDATEDRDRVQMAIRRAATGLLARRVANSRGTPA